MWGSRIAGIGGVGLVAVLLTGCAAGHDPADCAEMQVLIDEFSDATGAVADDADGLDDLHGYVTRFEAIGERDLAAATETLLTTLRSAADGGGDDVDDAAMTWGVAVADSLRACGVADD